MVNPEKLTI